MMVYVCVSSSSSSLCIYISITDQSVFFFLLLLFFSHTSRLITATHTYGALERRYTHGQRGLREREYGKICKKRWIFQEEEEVQCQQQEQQQETSL